jgi:NitT/TauT family transport system permease protein
VTVRWRQLAPCIAALAMIAGLPLPPGPDRGAMVFADPAASTICVLAAALFSGMVLGDARRSIALGLIGLALGCAAAVMLLNAEQADAAGVAFWTVVLGTLLGATILIVRISALEPRGDAERRAVDIGVPLLFGAYLFFLWEMVVRGFQVPRVLMPAPSEIAVRFFTSLPTLGEDFVQTFVRGVLSGYVIGCVAGFLVAIAADRTPFLRRGLLPFGNFVSALPIVGIAPIMVMWFGFDWPSKAAVVAVITFFPMLVNTLAGLMANGRIERDLMRSYAADYAQTLLKLRLPAAMPFIFNALKINSTLALIGAIVAEFFGTPVHGMGFRIAVEVGRMSLDMVWAEIALAAIAGTAFYGLVALAERATTFWHPSYRA